ncbi:GNAT family N-acetyltransferase [Kaistia terrae]|uniref:GNAT family N-acetyltransferase n=1 Tax=Kaistia terrae TaxID=537017 RepID=A0ABW0Q2D1_9HYPH|nr:GNAT family N-acetyltransferase [Kaistia terrae]MCX5581530.1 GNAT family N-acetyltransferase [Kaistia terrae]
MIEGKYHLRPLAGRDIDALYAISLATGLSGGDASALYDDPTLMGAIYSVPYAVLSPETAFVAEDRSGVAGYVIGALDTLAFEAQLEATWWPRLRGNYAEPPRATQTLWTADERRIAQIYHPRRTPLTVAEAFPSHVHINLLPRAQRQGIGTALLSIWFERVRTLGASGIHAGVNPGNSGALAFWQARGMTCLPPISETTVWLGGAIEYLG